MKISTTGTFGVVLALAAALAWPSARVVAGADDEDVKKRIAVLEAGQKEIIRQLQEIKVLLLQQNRPPQPARQPVPTAQAPVAPPALPAAPISIEGAAARGNANAKVVIIEFSDFQCPFCGRYTRETFNQLDREYVDTGKVRYVFRNFPLEKIHPNAFKAAEAAECARQDGKFWPLHDRLFLNQQALSDVELLNHAKAVGMDGPAFQKCVTGPVAAKIRQDLEDGARAGVTGTPAFYLGTVQKDGKVHVLRRVSGAVPYANFKATIDSLLASSEVAKQN